MNNVKAGKFVDDETGEALNDVEKVLGELGIALRDTNGLFRDSDDVLDEVASRWESFDSVAQHAIATAFAGTRQQEKFIVLMKNYGSALDYAQTATNSAGTAMEKYEAYTEGVEGKMNALKAAFEKFSVAFLDSDLVVGVIEFFTLIMNGIAGVVSFIDSIGGLPTVLLAVASALLLVNGGLIAYNTLMKITTAYTAIISFFTKLKNGLMSVTTVIPNAITAWKAYAAGTVTASAAMQASIPVIGLVLAAVTALVGIFSAVNTATAKASQKVKEAASAAAELSDEISQLTYKYLELSDAVKSDNSAKEALLQTQDDLLAKLKLEKYEIDDLIEKYGTYAEAIKHASLEDLQESERDLRGGHKVATDNLINEAKDNRFSSGFMEISNSKAAPFWRDPDSEHYAGYAILKALEDAGYISPGSYSKFTDDNGKQYSVGFSIYQRDKYDMSTPEGILQAYNDLGAMLDIAGNVGGENNFVYEGLYQEYRSMSEYVDSYETSVNDLNDNLAQQYALNELLGKEIPKTKEEFEKYRQAVIDNAISSGEFAGTNEDIANAIDSVLSKQSSFVDFYNAPENGAEGATIALKSVFDMLEEVQGGYDGLVSAMSNVTDEGYLTADALSTLFQLEKDNALAGLNLADILEQDANGYKLAEDALEQYIQALITANMVEGKFASAKDRDNAIANLKTLSAVLATLAATQNDSTKASQARRKELEKEQDAYKEQIDKFEELIELRKELLESYKEELDYQKELEKKQRNVATLQTKLTVARLDTSAAGQARVRELEAELKEAQEELDDFTLEHAIDVLTDQLDDTSEEWKSMIQSKLDKISALLERLDAAPDINVDTSRIETWLRIIDQHISDLGEDSIVSKPRWTTYQDAVDAGYGNIIDIMSASGSEKARIAKQYGSYQAYLDAMYKKYMGKPPTYHTGGLVGGISTLNSNEEFAKLLKGEFVSTPAQMRHFMEDTLPKIANYTTASGNNEFHAPLIEITCENVTTESLPELEKIVSRAVEVIKKELDSGMSRTGFKRPMTKRLV